jgi:protein DGCR14
LNTFQACNTLEDNSVRKKKWAWAWEAQKWVEQQPDKITEKRETMLIELPSTTGVKEKFTIEFPKPASLITEGSDSNKAGQ